MKLSTTVLVAFVSLILLADPAAAGSGLGKGMTAPMAGTVATVNPGAMSFSCHCGARNRTFATSPGTVFRNGSNPASFSDLAPGQSVQIQYHSSAGNAVADNVSIGP